MLPMPVYILTAVWLSSQLEGFLEDSTLPGETLNDDF